MADAPKDRVKTTTGVVVAAVVVVAGLASVVVLMVFKVIEADAGLPILAGGITGGGVFLWNKANTQPDPPNGAPPPA